MELIVITPTKLKIMLTPPDMKRYDLTPARMDCADEETRRSFRRIFDDAKTQIGFDTTGKRLLVQLYTSRGGGCEIFVTKLGEKDTLPPEIGETPAEDEETPVQGGRPRTGESPEDTLLRRVFAVSSDDDEDPPEPSPAPLPAVREKPRSGARCPRRIATRKAAMVFDSMTALLAVCRRLTENHYDGESSAYILEGGRSCLFLTLPDTSFFTLPAAFAFLAEYGQETDAGTLDLHLSEHAGLLCRTDAVHVLGALA